MPNKGEHLLQVEDLVTGYGNKRVIDRICLTIEPGEIVALIGHNGAGKTTLLKAVFGVLPTWDGKVLFDGQPLKFHKSRDLIRLGIAYAPQGNRVFTDLTVRENLEVAGLILEQKTDLRCAIERALDSFPALSSHVNQLARTLSGGEKQMLALSMVLISSPRLLLLDEPSLGLATPLVRKVFLKLKEITKDLGTAVLVAEQRVREILEVAANVYVLRSGQVSFSGPTRSLRDESKLREVYL